MGRDRKPAHHIIVAHISTRTNRGKEGSKGRRQQGMGLRCVASRAQVCFFIFLYYIYIYIILLIKYISRYHGLDNKGHCCQHTITTPIPHHPTHQHDKQWGGLKMLCVSSPKQVGMFFFFFFFFIY